MAGFFLSARHGTTDMNGTTRLRLYVRIGCHLCEDMLFDLQRLIDAQWKDQLEQPDIVDIDEDAELKRRFDTRVPVLMLGEQVLCEYYLDPIAISAALEREQA